jgi:hypothetical protein|nr:MAG TPA: hypothetical protein [Caudoviricetes sp.]
MISFLLILFGMIPYTYMEQRHRGRRGALVDLRMVGIIIVITGWVVTFFEYNIYEAIGRIVIETLIIGFVLGMIIHPRR